MNILIVCLEQLTGISVTFLIARNKFKAVVQDFQQNGESFT